MTNKEYFKDKIVNIALSGEQVAIDKNTNAPGVCRLMADCENCLLYIEESAECNDNLLWKWSEQEYIERVDWSKVKRGTVINVSNDNKTWYKRQFVVFFNGKVYCCNPRNDFLVSWKYARLIKENCYE